MTGKRNPSILLAGVFAFIVGGCSNNPNPPAWNDENTIFSRLGAEPGSYDPVVSYTVNDGVVMDLIYPSYYRYNYLHQNPWTFDLNVGLKEPERIPFSGTLHTKTGDKLFTGEQWILEIRHDMKFQDDPCFPGGKGRNITAKDIEYAVKRMANPKLEFPLADQLSDKMLGWEDYGNAFAKLGDKNYDQPLDGFKIDPQNPYKFSIFFTTKYPQFRFLLAMHFTTPTAREAVEKYKDDFKLKHPVGCGAFKLAEYTPHNQIVLVRNPNCNFETYPTSGAPGTPKELLADAGKPLPLVNRLVIRLISETVTTYNLFDQGYLDSWGIGQANAQSMLHAIRPGAEMTKRGLVMKQGSYPAVEYCGFNMEDPVFGGYTPQKRKLRQAISLAIDSNAYIDLMYQGLAQKSEFLLPHGLCGFDENYKNPYRAYQPDLVKAKQLLAEAGYPDGVSATTHERLVLNYDNYTDSPTDRERERLITKLISALGIEVTSRDTDYPTFDDKVKHKKIQFFTYGWVADYPDPENFCLLLYGPLASPGPNGVVYKNPEYDRLFEQMRGMDDGPARADVIHKMRDLAVEDCAWIYLVENEAPTVYQPWVVNAESNPILNDIAKYRNIDVEKRKRLQAEWNAPVIGPFFIALILIIVGSIPAVATVNRKRNRRARVPASKTGGQN